MRENAFRRFIKRKPSVIGGIVLLIFLLMAVCGPQLCRYDPNKVDLTAIYQPCSLTHLLGTDNLGRDTLTRIIYGSRVTLSISFAGVFAGSFLGVILGVCAGYYGGVIDSVLSRIMDILLSFPTLLMAIAVVAILGNGVQNTIIAIGFSSIPTVARMVRSIVVSIKNAEYVQACHVMGISHFRIITTHIIPNSMSQIIVNTTLNLGTGILSASSLSFLGLGVVPPNPEWGAMLSTAREVLRTFPLAALAPGVAITLVVLSFSLVGDGLRDALDPKLKNS